MEYVVGALAAVFAWVLASLLYGRMPLWYLALLVVSFEFVAYV